MGEGFQNHGGGFATAGGPKAGGGGGRWRVSLVSALIQVVAQGQNGSQQCGEVLAALHLPACTPQHLQLAPHLHPHITQTHKHVEQAFPGQGCLDLCVHMYLLYVHVHKALPHTLSACM